MISTPAPSPSPSIFFEAFQFHSSPLPRFVDNTYVHEMLDLAEYLFAPHHLAVESPAPSVVDNVWLDEEQFVSMHPSPSDKHDKKTAAETLPSTMTHFHLVPDEDRMADNATSESLTKSSPMLGDHTVPEIVPTTNMINAANTFVELDRMADMVENTPPTTQKPTETMTVEYNVFLMTMPDMVSSTSLCCVLIFSIFAFMVLFVSCLAPPKKRSRAIVQVAEPIVVAKDSDPSSKKVDV